MYQNLLNVVVWKSKDMLHISAKNTKFKDKKINYVWKMKIVDIVYFI